MRIPSPLSRRRRLLIAAGLVGCAASSSVMSQPCRPASAAAEAGARGPAAPAGAPAADRRQRRAPFGIGVRGQRGRCRHASVRSFGTDLEANDVWTDWHWTQPAYWAAQRTHARLRTTQVPSGAPVDERLPAASEEPLVPRRVGVAGRRGAAPARLLRLCRQGAAAPPPVSAAVAECRARVAVAVSVEASRAPINQRSVRLGLTMPATGRWSGRRRASAPSPAKATADSGGTNRGVQVVVPPSSRDGGPYVSSHVERMPAPPSTGGNPYP